MHPRLALALCCCALFGLGFARAELSPAMRARIMADFPPYHPNPPAEKKTASPVGEPAPLSDDPLVLLPRYYVDDSRLAQADPDKLLSKRQVQAKAMAVYKDSLTPLEWALNSWYIPLFGSPPSARGRAYYEEKKVSDESKRLQRLLSLGKPGD